MDPSVTEILENEIKVSITGAIIKSIIVILFAYIVWGLMKRMNLRLFESLGRKHKYSKKKILTISKTLNSATGYLIFFIAVTMVLSSFGIPTASIL